jgi:hypothetical protein
MKCSLMSGVEIFGARVLLRMIYILKFVLEMLY